MLESLSDRVVSKQEAFPRQLGNPPLSYLLHVPNPTPSYYDPYTHPFIPSLTQLYPLLPYYNLAHPYILCVASLMTC